MLKIRPEAEDNGVIGDDDRFRITDTTRYPFQAIVSVSNASGVVIGKNTVLTCAHVAVNLNPGDILTPGKNAAITPFGSFTISAVYIHEQYLTAPVAFGYDCAVLVVNANDSGLAIGETVRPVSVRVGGPLAQGENVSSLGYPQDKPAGTLWQGDGKVVEYDLPWVIDNMTPVDADITAGDSGGPILYDGEVFALNSAIYVNANYGMTIDENIYAFIAKHINE